MATLAEGTRQMVEDVLVNFNLVHLSPRVETLFESLEDAGLVTAAVNCYVCRGRVRHPLARPAARRIARRLVGSSDAVYGPRRYFFGELFATDETGAPRNFGGSVDRHGGHVARWLVTRDGFDFLFLYLYEHGCRAAPRRRRDGRGRPGRHGLALLVEAAGGWDPFLERYAVAVVADHSQSAVEQISDLHSAACRDLRLFRSSRHDDPTDCDLALATGNRVAMAYLLPGGSLTAPELGHRLARDPAATSSCGGGQLVSPCAARAASCGSARAATTSTRAATPGRWRATPTCSTRPSTPTRWSGSTARWAAGGPAT